MKNYSYIFVIVLLIVIALLLFRECNSDPIDSHEDYEALKKERDTLKIKEQDGFKKLDSLANVNTQLDSARLVAEEKIDVISGELNNTIAKNTVLIKRIRDAQGNKDTVEIVVMCDSLLTIVEAQNDYIAAYDRYVAEVTEIHSQQMAVKDTMIEQQAKMYSNLRMAFDNQAFRCDAIHKDLQKALKKNKRLTVSLFAGYGAMLVEQQVRFGPQAGIGISYKLIR